MSILGRRKLIKAFASLPFFGAVAGVRSVAEEGDKPSRSSQDEFELKYLAVRTLRFINTAESWHYRANGTFIDLEGLGSSASVQKLITDEKAEKSGIGKSLFSRMNVRQTEIVPGWRCAFRYSGDMAGYVCVLHSTDKRILAGFSTDERALIYEGVPLDGASAPKAVGAAQVLGSPSVILTSSAGGNGGVRALARTIAFGMAPQICCRCSYKCCCNCGCYCQPLNIDGCQNCGCGSCVWCCCV